jgi:hypothetical protein
VRHGIACSVGRLGERDRVAIRIRDLHVTDTVRVGLDRLVLDALGGEAREKRVESSDGECDPTRPRPCRVRLDEKRGVLGNIPEDLITCAQVGGTSKEPRVPIDTGVEIGYRNTGNEVGDRTHLAMGQGGVVMVSTI